MGKSHVKPLNRDEFKRQMSVYSEKKPMKSQQHGSYVICSKPGDQLTGDSTEKRLLVKKTFVSSKEDIREMEEEINTKRSLNIPILANVNSFYAKYVSGMCGDAIKIKISIEYMEKTLANEIRERRRTLKADPERRVTSLLFNLNPAGLWREWFTISSRAL